MVCPIDTLATSRLARKIEPATRSEEQEVVDPAVALLQGELPNRDAEAGADVGLGGVLDDPARSLQLPVDVDSRPRLPREVGVALLGHGQ